MHAESMNSIEVVSYSLAYLHSSSTLKCAVGSTSPSLSSYRYLTALADSRIPCKATSDQPQQPFYVTARDTISLRHNMGSTQTSLDDS
jgi:hypothetical protein